MRRDLTRFILCFMLAVGSAASALASSPIAENPASETSLPLDASPFQRSEAIHQHYGRYQDAMQSASGSLELRVHDLREVEVSGFSNLLVDEVLTIAPEKYLSFYERFLWNEDSEEYLPSLVPEWQSLSEERDNKAGERYSLRHLVEDIDFAKHQRRPDYASLFSVSVDFQDHSQTYRAMAFWLVDEQNGLLELLILDQGLREIQQLGGRLNKVKDTARLLTEDKARRLQQNQAMPNLDATKEALESGRTCRVKPPTTYEWDELPEASYQPAILKRDEGFRVTRTSMHETGSHFVSGQLRVACQCNSHCDAIASAEIVEIRKGDSGLINKCHRGDDIVHQDASGAGATTDTDLVVTVNGGLAWSVGECFTPTEPALPFDLDLCQFGQHCSDINLDVNFIFKGGKGVIGEAGIEATFEINETMEREKLLVPMNADCPPCIEQFPVSVTVPLVAPFETFDFVMSYMDKKYPEEGPSTEELDSVTVRNGTLVHAPDTRTFGSLVADGVEVTVWARDPSSTNPVTPDPRCPLPQTGTVSGGELKFIFNCAQPESFEVRVIASGDYSSGPATLELVALLGADGLPVNEQMTINAIGEYTFPSRLRAGAEWAIHLVGQDCLNCGLSAVPGLTGSGLSQDIVVHLDCSSNEEESCTPGPGGSGHRISGRICLSNRNNEEKSLDDIRVRLEANPPAGSTAEGFEEITDAVSLGEEDATCYEVEFENEVPEGWSWDVRPIDIPQGVDCYYRDSHQGTGTSSGDIANIDIECLARDPDLDQTPFGNGQACELYPESALCQGGVVWFVKCFVIATLEWVEIYDDFRERWIWRQHVSYHVSCVYLPKLDGTGPPVTVEETFTSPDLVLDLPIEAPGATPSVVQGQPFDILGTVADEQGVEGFSIYLNGQPLSPSDYTLSGGDYTGAIDTSGLAPGTHTLQIFAMDGNGDKPTLSPLEVAFEVVAAPSGCSGDTAGPALDFTPQGGDSLGVGNTPINISTSDSSGVDRVRVFVNGNPEALITSAPWQHTWNAPAGEHMVLVRSWDACGNQTDLRHLITVCDGPEAPDVTLSYPSDGATLTQGETVTLTATASDDDRVTKVQFFREGGVWLGADTTAPYSLDWTVAPGVTEIKARAWDACDNTRADTALVTVGPSAAPGLTVLGPDHSVLSSGATIDWGTLDYGAENNEWNGWRLFPKVRNDGDAELTTSLSLSSGGLPFAIGSNVVDSPLGSGLQDYFVVRLYTDTAGSHQAQVGIEHNDPNAPNPFLINLTGVVREAPQVRVSRATNVLDFDEVLNIGSFAEGIGQKNRGFTVENLAPAGASGLEWGPVEVVNTQGAAFTWSGTLVSPLASGDSDNFAVNLSTDMEGDFRALVKVWHNDPNAPNPHQFVIEASVLGPQTTTFDVIEDSWVEQLSPNANYGTRTTLETRSTLSQMGRSSYLKFNVSGMSGPVQSAKLRIRSKANFPSSRLYWISDTSWSETGITWNNAPLGYHLQRVLGSLPTGWVEIDVTDIVSGNGTYTLGFTAADEPLLGFYSRESGSPASLIVTYQP